MLRALALGALLGAPAQAQLTLFGPWEDDASMLVGSVELFVAPTGSDVNGTGTAANPYRSITRALEVAGANIGDPANPVAPFPPVPVLYSINVAPGTYNADEGEDFPLRMPARGLALEAWPWGASAGAERPKIEVSGGQVGIQVDWEGALGVPHSVIQNFEIEGGESAIDLVPADLMEAPLDTLGVEVRGNDIHDALFGIRIQTEAEWIAEHVIENNTIGDKTAVQGRAITETVRGFSSTLYRSNRVRMYEEGIRVTNEPGGVAVPRLFSNFVQLGESLVVLENCQSHVLNNTLAFAVDFTIVPFVQGLELSGGQAELHNNILWCPDTPSQTPAKPLVSNAMLFQQANRIGGNALPGPGLLGGDLHPGYAITDLHLSPFSPMIGAGVNHRVAHPTHTVQSVLVQGQVLRTDVSVDNDLDGRFYRAAIETEVDPRVDIGGDEFIDLTPGLLPACRIEMPVTALQDSFGNLLATGSPPSSDTRSWMVDFDLWGPPNGLYVLLLGFGFYEQTLDAGLQLLAPNGALWQHSSYPLSGLGNLRLDFDPFLHLTVTTGSFGPNGTDAQHGLSLGSTDVSAQEAEWCFQMLTFDLSSQRVGASNRITLELNETP